MRGEDKKQASMLVVMQAAVRIDHKEAGDS
jgi:hypothetical protein